mgnify:CR=1 FL=1
MRDAATQTERERAFASAAMILRALAEGALLVDTAGTLRQINAAAATLLAVDADTVLADNRAAGGEKIRRYLDDTRLTESQAELGVRLVFVLIAIDDKDAASQTAELVETYAGRVRWLVVRNHRDGESLHLYENSHARRALRELGAGEVSVPCLIEATRNRLQHANLTVGKGRFSEKLPILDRSRCIRFHDLMTGEFLKAGDLLIG